MNTSRGKTVILSVIIAAALLLRIAGLQEKTFYIDEAHSYVLAGHEISDVIKGSASESNPPLPALIFHFWQNIARDEWQLRSISVAMNILAIIIIFS